MTFMEKFREAGENPKPYNEHELSINLAIMARLYIQEKYSAVHDISFLKDNPGLINYFAAVYIDEIRAAYFHVQKKHTSLPLSVVNGKLEAKNLSDLEKKFTDTTMKSISAPKKLQLKVSSDYVDKLIPFYIDFGPMKQNKTHAKQAIIILDEGCGFATM